MSEVLTPISLDGKAEALLVPGAEPLWIRVDNMQVGITRTDEGVVVDITPLGRNTVIASTYAFSQEAKDLLEGDEDGPPVL